MIGDKWTTPRTQRTESTLKIPRKEKQRKDKKLLLNEYQSRTSEEKVSNGAIAEIESRTWTRKFRNVTVHISQETS